MTLIALTALFPMSTATANKVSHYYTVTIDEDLGRLSIEAQFSHPVKRITARSRNAGRFIENVQACADNVKVEFRYRRMLLPANGVNCLKYSVDLRRAAKMYRYANHLAPQNVVVPAAFWLWRPPVLDGNNIQIEFRLPHDIQVSVPWLLVDKEKSLYLLSESPENAIAPIAIGHFDQREIEVPGSTLRVAFLAGKLHMNLDMNNDQIASWIKAAATDVSLTYGRFPNPSPQVVIVPIAASRSAVPFGQVIRDGGETVELSIDPTQPLDKFLSDWKATHEFSHLMLPYITRRHRWISEGFAQYYQNVLSTRSGAHEASYAWQKIYDGLRRGQQYRPQLSPNQAAAGGSRSGGMKVYWSGTALALLADVQLREHSHGRDSLDAVLGRFQACCLPSSKIWSGPEFFAKLDTLIDEPLFVPLYDQHADAAGFPDTSELFIRLGLRIIDGEVSLDHDSELHEIRDAITKKDDATAAWRAQLTTD